MRLLKNCEAEGIDGITGMDADFFWSGCAMYLMCVRRLHQYQKIGEILLLFFYTRKR